jgi:ferredoxin
MLGAEKRTGSGKQTATARATEPAAGDTSPPSGRWFVRTGIDAVNATERLICGTAVVDSPAVAEGLAVSGRRAATLLARNRSLASLDVVPTARAAWVHHRIRPGQPRPHGRMAFELVAADAQEAVDHCLVAHRITARLEMPGVCTVDSAVAGGLQLVRFPGEVAINVLDLPADDKPISVEDAAGEAFESIAEATGRKLAAVTQHRMDGARYVLVTSGDSATAARRCVDALRTAGVPVGAVNVALVRPFPVAELHSVLGGIEAIAAIDAPSKSDDDDGLAVKLSAVFDDDDTDRIRPVEFDSGTDAELWNAIRKTLGLKLDGNLPSTAQGTDSSSQAIAFGVTPAGPWGAELLFETAALIGNLDGLSLCRPDLAFDRTIALCIGRGDCRTPESARLDLLFVAHPSLLGDGAPLVKLRDGGTVVVQAEAPTSEAAWFSIPQPVRKAISRRGLHLKWIDVRALAADTEIAADDVRTLLAGALLAADGTLGIRLGCDRDLLAWKLGPDAAPDLESALLTRGAEALVELDLETMGESPPQEKDFAAEPDLPRMPEPAAAQPDAELHETLRHFHLTGESAEPMPALPLRPALLDALTHSAPVWRGFPLVIDTPTEATTVASGAISLFDLLTHGLQKMKQAGDTISILDQQVSALVRLARRIVDERGGVAPFEEILAETLERFASAIDLSDAGTTTLRKEIDALQRNLPRTGSLLGFGDRSLLLLHAAALRDEHARRTGEFNKTVETLAQQLGELLQVDDSHGPQGTSAEAVGATLGAPGERFFDPAALSTRLPQRGSKRLEPERRSRIERTLDTLRTYLEGKRFAAELLVVHAGLDVVEDDLSGARWVEHPDALRASIGLFDGVAASMLEILRALRVAHLEAHGHYDAARHDRMLERFGWQSLSADELLLVPPVVVVETAERLRGSSLASFSELLRSGRPVQVLVSDHVSELEAGEAWHSLRGYDPGLGYVAVAHREAIVVQSSFGDPEHLISGLQRLAASLRPAVAIVAEPSASAPVAPWLQLAASHVGRATPCFRYDPDAGTSWAERFDLSDNPQPDKAWPELELRYLDEAGAERQLTEAFTFAHAAALDPAYRLHFRALAPEESTDELIELAAYLSESASRRRRRLPFIWVVDERGRLVRALVTRELAFATRDHARAWRILQELGGLDNEYARRAAQEARDRTLVEAGEARKQLEAAHAEQIEQVRRTEAAAAMERLANVLLNVDDLPLGQLAPAAPAAPPAEMPVVEEPVAEALEEAVEEEEELITEEPYIDSMLCTTCQDCINISPQMFKYNDNKQAFIADASAGTFEQLVKAAEKCPARCIHPGVPRSDDSTATDDLITRANKFR